MIFLPGNKHLYNSCSWTVAPLSTLLVPVAVYCTHMRGSALERSSISVEGRNRKAAKRRANTKVLVIDKVHLILSGLAFANKWIESVRVMSSTAVL
jgi:hypothetical protein